MLFRLENITKISKNIKSSSRVKKNRKKKIFSLDKVEKRLQTLTLD